MLNWIHGNRALTVTMTIPWMILNARYFFFLAARTRSDAFPHAAKRADGS